MLQCGESVGLEGRPRVSARPGARGRRTGTAVRTSNRSIYTACRHWVRKGLCTRALSPQNDPASSAVASFERRCVHSARGSLLEKPRSRPPPFQSTCPQVTVPQFPATFSRASLSTDEADVDALGATSVPLSVPVQRPLPRPFLKLQSAQRYGRPDSRARSSGEPARVAVFTRMRTHAG